MQEQILSFSDESRQQKYHPNFGRGKISYQHILSATHPFGSHVKAFSRECKKVAQATGPKITETANLKRLRVISAQNSLWKSGGQILLVCT